MSANTLILFGATGDLAQRMLLPSLYGLHAEGLLPQDLVILGTSRRALDSCAFRTAAGAALERHVPKARLGAATVRSFLARLAYAPLDAADIESYSTLAAALPHGAERRVAIFLSTAPSLFAATIEGLRRAGLAASGSRLALEKPLGLDLESSREINDAVAKVFAEAQTFRLDHYLGKETVQNLLALRFGNALFEPLWNAAGIDHVQITVAETVGLEGRTVYDGAGAVRDMLQSHMLQLLALVAMEAPARIEAGAVRSEKVKVLEALRPLTATDAPKSLVLGQYGAGGSDNGLPAYVEELGSPSHTETFVALKGYVDNWRWNGTPFYLRTGKRLPVRRSEIVIQFRDVPHSIFEGRGGVVDPNRLVIQLQPEENVRLMMMAKQPGLGRDGMRLREVPLDIGIDNAFTEIRRRIAYERLLLDLIDGDPTLFLRRDEVEAQWRYIDGLRRSWETAGMSPYVYPAGTWGPLSAGQLLACDGRAWRR